MSQRPSASSLIAAAALFICAAFIPHLAGWTESARFPEVAVAVLAAFAVSVLRVQDVAINHRDSIAPRFVVTIAALLLLGPQVATLVAVVAAVAPLLLSARAGTLPGRVAVDVAVTAAAACSSGFFFTWLFATSQAWVADYAEWPWRTLWVGATVLAYYVVQGGLASMAVPLVLRQPVDRSWPKAALRGSPLYLIGATISILLVELIERRMWPVLPVFTAALALAYRVYADYVDRLHEGQRRQEVLEFLDQGMCVLDRGGLLTLWNDALERLTGCSRSHALGRTIEQTMAALGRSALPKAIDEALQDGSVRIVPQVYIPSTPPRTLQVKVVPVASGVTLLWHDITERLTAERELKRSGERLALAAEGANDGLWQLTVRTQELYVSGRWREMVGLPAEPYTGRPAEWFERVHPEDIAPLKEALEAHLSGRTPVFQHEHRIRHEDGTYRRFLCRGLAVKARGAKADRIAGSLTDTTEQAIAQERLRSVGFLDPLTGLYNRAVFVEGLGRRLEEFKLRRVTSSFAVLYLDLDRFKIVNDSLGHLVGDELLVAVSRRLESCLRPGDALARLGGDEFAVLLSSLNDDAQANAIAFRIQEAVSAPFSIGGREVFTSASIGIAFGPAHYTNPDEVMRDADTAMYHAKSRGKARHEIFDEAMHARVRDRLSLENDLRRAITSGVFEKDFEVVYQPIVSLASGMCVGFESLIRWSRNGEPVSPATFVPIAEELGLIEQLGTWVMQQACLTFADWQRRFPEAGLDCITVNVSSRQLVQQNFTRVVQNTVEAAGLKPADVRVEITETALLDNPGEAAAILQELRRFGVKVYLDDFGTGYSSLSHLHKLPVDALKIDRSFVKSLLLPDRPAIVESILALARTLKTSVVAEGIEEAVQARELERLGCTHAQGFLFSKPLSTRNAEALVMACQPLGPKGAAREMSVA